jgi:formylglycine-generating enzyme required for sulfatase activity
MKRNVTAILLTAAISFLAPVPLSAVTINTVPVGNAGNAGDVQSQGTFGAVGYNYRIGTTEVTNEQYTEFLNAVAATDTYELYNTLMESTTWGGITRTGMSGSFVYSVKTDAGAYTYADKPVVWVSWWSAARFANWLHNGQPMGAQDSSTTEVGAYRLFGAWAGRLPGATWFLPSENEWYKAAYYDGDAETYYDYPTGTDTTPDNNFPTSDSGNSANFYDNGNTTGDFDFPLTDVGAYALSASPYGTFDQGGNVAEWNETVIGGPSARGLRGGSWGLDSSYLLASDQLSPTSTSVFVNVGFRVATVPEPSTAVLAIAACGLMWVLRKRFK